MNVVAFQMTYPGGADDGLVLSADTAREGGEGLGQGPEEDADARRSRVAFRGAGLVIIAALGLVANFALPWLAFPEGLPDGSTVRFRADLREAGAVSYEQSLLTWPVAALGLIGVTGLALTSGAFWMRGRNALAAGLGPTAWVLAYAGFLLALTGTRWLGFYGARLADDEATSVHLHVVPYLNLCLGLLAAAVGIRILVRCLESSAAAAGPAASGAVAALSLVALPLVPFGRAMISDSTFYLDEFTIAVIGSTPQEGHRAAQALAAARWALWCTFYAGALGSISTTLGRGRRVAPRWRWLQHATRVNIIFVGAGAFLTIQFYSLVALLHPGTELLPNVFLPLGFLSLGSMWIAEVRGRLASDGG